MTTDDSSIEPIIQIQASAAFHKNLLKILTMARQLPIPVPEGVSIETPLTSELKNGDRSIPRN